MEQQIALPGVQDGDGTRQCPAEVLAVAGEREQCRGGALKKQVVDRLGQLSGQRAQLLRQRGGEQEVRHGQQ